MKEAEATQGAFDDSEAWIEAFSQIGRLGFTGIASLMGLGLWMAWVWFALNGPIPVYGQGTYDIGAPSAALLSFALTMGAGALSPRVETTSARRHAPLVAGGLATLGCLMLVAESHGLLPAALSVVAAILCGHGAAVLLFMLGLSFCRLDAGPALVAFVGCTLACFLTYFCITSIGEAGNALFSLLPLLVTFALHADLRKSRAAHVVQPSARAETQAGTPRGFRRLLLACFVYFAAISFTHAMAPIEEHGFASDAGVACMLFVEIIVLLVYVTRRGTFRILKVCYTASVMLILFANVVAPFTGDANLAYEALRNASYFILFMVVWLLLSWVAFYGEIPACRVFGEAFFLAGLGMALGWVGGIALHLQFGDTRDAFTMGVGLVVVAFFSFGFNVRDFPSLVTHSGRDGKRREPDERRPSVIAQIEEGLSPRECDVFAYLAQGYGSEYIAEQLGVSYHTVRAHVRSIYKKLDVHSREELLDKVRDEQSESMRMRRREKVHDRETESTS